MSSVGNPGERIRVALADDSYLVREAVSQILARHPRIDLVAVCEDRDSLLAAVESEHPGVVVTDIRMPPERDEEGIEIATCLRDSHPEVGVVVLSQYAEPRYGLALLEAGSDGRAYMLKERVGDVTAFMDALRRVAAGGTVLDRQVVAELMAPRDGASRQALAGLTGREQEVLALMAEGRSNTAIAESLVVTPGAVEKHITNIFAKLDLGACNDDHRRVLAVLAYLREPR